MELLASAYGHEEARRNLSQRGQRIRLSRLMRSVTIVREAADPALPKGIVLPARDRPILLAAISGEATHLLTGDVTHFGRYFGHTIEGVQIMLPADYLQLKGREPNS